MKEMDKDQKARVDDADTRWQAEIVDTRMSLRPERTIYSIVACSLMRGLLCWAAVPGGGSME